MKGLIEVFEDLDPAATHPQLPFHVEQIDGVAGFMTVKDTLFSHDHANPIRGAIRRHWHAAQPLRALAAGNDGIRPKKFR